jgi:uncharacterized DUF497 family protein
MPFEWDATKDRANRVKHRIGFREATEIFRGFVLLADDVRHDYGERRQIALGIYDGDVIRVVFTERGDTTRIISAWKANRHDREIYKQAQQGRPL